MMEVEGTLLIWSRSASLSQLYGSAGKVRRRRSALICLNVRAFQIELSR